MTPWRAVRCDRGGISVAQATCCTVDIFTVSKNSILKWSWVIGRPLSCAALLLPFLASADSQLNTRAVNGAVLATAHLDFKIIIPKVLSLEMGTLRLESGIGGQPCGRHSAIMSNNRNVTLSATAGAAANTHRMTCTVSMP